MYAVFISDQAKEKLNIYFNNLADRKINREMAQHAIEIINQRLSEKDLLILDHQDKVVFENLLYLSMKLFKDRYQEKSEKTSKKMLEFFANLKPITTLEV